MVDLAFPMVDPVPGGMVGPDDLGDVFQCKLVYDF